MQRQKVDGQPAFVLHAYPFRETSLIVEAFTREFGRMALLARGARRPRSALRGLLMAFQPLELAWAGKGEVLTLMKVEWQGGIPLLRGEALFCGYYLNELLMHLLPREDAHERLFDRYRDILGHLAADPGGKVKEADLRAFEKALLQELGYGLTLDHDSDGRPITAAAHYHYRMEQGPVRLAHADEAEDAVRGQTLIDLAAEDFADSRSRAEAKQLMRTLMAYYLSGKELETRKIFKELQEL
ncbi:MAG TPA: DNA repair protein RecO [Rhodocyclaceae bacterium]|nr:DNA repair protein RecO [Rhodocyclaceae bacterium]HMV21642.1 DNA repair protein RecO [Rhodocyclaceae bacterium]HNE43294.1 DNA repair protein RecO [Rhodocyclaceae bacterium]HNM22105.1 DNA repair protein RecO [Rhodocyclaceae bacterium]HNM79618.1 DNA repair protein RecO [Rhodocyclaceae bacterium]